MNLDGRSYIGDLDVDLLQYFALKFTCYPKNGSKLSYLTAKRPFHEIRKFVSICLSTQNGVPAFQVLSSEASSFVNKMSCRMNIQFGWSYFR
jgi:hypothetical protein